MGYELIFKDSELVIFWDLMIGLIYGVLSFSDYEGGGEVLLNCVNKLMFEFNYCDLGGESINLVDDCCGNDCLGTEDWWKACVDVDFVLYLEMIDIMVDLYFMMIFGNFYFF